MYAVAMKGLGHRDLAWEGNSDEGSFTYDNGSGDVMAMVWQGQRLVAAVYDHESARNDINDDWDKNKNGHKPADDPAYFFPNFPEEMLALLNLCKDKIESKCGDGNVTAALWADGKGCFASEGRKQADEHGLWMLENYVSLLERAVVDPEAKVPAPIKDAFFSGLVGNIHAPVASNAWRFQYSLSPAQVELALWLGGQLNNDGEAILNDDQWRAFVDVDESRRDFGSQRPLEPLPENTPEVVRVLAMLGIKTQPQ